MMLMAVTIVSLILAAVMSIVAWRVSREEHRRAEARIAALAAEIHEQTSDFELRTSPAFPREPFAAPSSGTAKRYATVVAAGAFVCATIGALAVVSSNPRTLEPRTLEPRTFEPSNPGTLELLTLDAERDGDRLTIDGVIAVVLLFGRDGGFLTSSRAAIPQPVLGAGAAAPFVVTVPSAADVGRYRVSFRTEDRVVPHVDRRSST